MKLRIERIAPDAVIDGFARVAPLLMPLLTKAEVEIDRFMYDLMEGNEALLHILDGERLIGALTVRPGHRARRTVLIVTNLAGHFTRPWMEDVNCYLTVLAKAMNAQEIEWLTEKPVLAIAERYGFSPIGMLYRREVM